jgi:hypothetical protein
MDGIDISESRFAHDVLAIAELAGGFRWIGRRFGKGLVPHRVSNLTFGGALKDRLFIAGSHTPHAISLNRRGVPSP